MSKFVVVTQERHGNKRYRGHQDFGFVAHESVAQIVYSEMQAALYSMPIAFIEQSGTYALVAVLSLAPGRNLFVGPDNQWLGRYVPAVARAYPFRLHQKENSDQFALSIDEDSSLLVNADQTGESFFDNEGKPTKAIQDMMEFLVAFEKSRRGTDAAVAALAKAGVICPWKIKLNDKQDAPIDGLYRIDETALNTVSPEVFLELRKTGALPIAYAQIFSVVQIDVLQRLVQVQDNLRKAKPTPTPQSDTIEFKPGIIP